MSQPTNAFSILVMGETPNEVYQNIHEVFTHVYYQVVYTLVYAYFVFLVIRKKNRMDKKDASEYGTHGSSRWANTSEIHKNLSQDKEGFILGEHRNKLVVHPKN
ncbi:hypothetical protein, partial [Leifsonia shinshuensis]|uniref:hypothetical protein n=1 Tax=Leifsonia shinshuensis TaxID=150026 RepID=UPI0035F0320B